MHTMWKGSISFGLVNIPIKMFAATENKDIRFRQIHKECNTPIKYQKTCPTCDRDVTEDEIVKGYEYEPGHYVILTDEDFIKIKEEIHDKSVEIVDFVELKEIDPIFFDKTYYLSPQETGGKAYNLLRKAMEDTGKIAVAKITIRNRGTLAVLRVYNNVLALETIFYPDEVRPISEVPGVPQTTEVDKKELGIAQQLIDNLSTTFEPEKYKDEYRETLTNLIEQKIQGKEIQVAPKAPKTNVIDLMEALQASLKETKKKTPANKTTTRKASSKKTNQKKPTKKRTSAS